MPHLASRLRLRAQSPRQRQHWSIGLVAVQGPPRALCARDRDRDRVGVDVSMALRTPSLKRSITPTGSLSYAARLYACATSARSAQCSWLAVTLTSCAYAASMAASVGVSAAAVVVAATAARMM